jgi:septal ring factor EnvC (AmiA/AmiB activator)
MNKPPAMSTGTNHLDKTIQNWVELDNELKKLNEKVKDIRTRKNDIEDKIITYVEDNNMNNSVVNITDGKIKFCETKQTSPLTLGFLEKCLSEVIANQSQVKQIVDYIKSKRETKMVPEIKRYYN